jgi:hypothetical protein
MTALILGSVLLLGLLLLAVGPALVVYLNSFDDEQPADADEPL